MKIRTDFVTNSSSSSFVTYTVDNKSDKNKIIELMLFVQILSEKYAAEFIPDTYNGAEAIEFYDGLRVTLWIPGLSDSFIDRFFETDAEEKRAYETFQEYGRHDIDYPPDLDVAIAVIFGPNGDDSWYLSSIGLDTQLIDDNGHISSDVSTYLTEKEAIRLHYLVEAISYQKKEYIGGTD